MSRAVGSDVASCTSPSAGVTVSWGHYQREQTEDADGKARSIWYREPVNHQVEFRLDGEPDYREPLEGEDPDLPECTCPSPSGPVAATGWCGSCWFNNQHEPEKNTDTAWLFQPRLIVTALDGQSAVFAPVDDPADHATAGEEVPATAAAGSGAQLSMDEIARDDIDADGLRAALLPLADGYERWLDELDLAGLPADLRETGEHAVHTARKASQRIRAGIQLLTTPDAPGHDIPGHLRRLHTGPGRGPTDRRAAFLRRSSRGA